MPIYVLDVQNFYRKNHRINSIDDLNDRVYARVCLCVIRIRTKYKFHFQRLT